MRRQLIVLVLALTVVAVPQPATTPTPVSRADLVATTNRLEVAMRSVLRMPPPPLAPPGALGVATRDEVVAELDRLFEVFRPQFRWTPRPQRVVTRAIEERNADPATRERLHRLARFGMVGPVGPLVTGPARTLTPDELGDALGYFMGQVASLTYQPDPRWTPALMLPEDAGWAPAPEE